MQPLDAATSYKLREQAEALMAEGVPAKAARQQVWDSYLAEQAASISPGPEPPITQPSNAPPNTAPTWRDTGPPAKPWRKPTPEQRAFAQAQLEKISAAVRRRKTQP